MPRRLAGFLIVIEIAHSQTPKTPGATSNLLVLPGFPKTHGTTSNFMALPGLAARSPILARTSVA